MSPKEPEPIFRTSLYLPPTMNSALEPLLLAMARGGSRALPAGSAGQRGLYAAPEEEKGAGGGGEESGAAKDCPRAQLQPGPSGGGAPLRRLYAAPRLSARSGNRRSDPRGACESREGKRGGVIRGVAAAAGRSLGRRRHLVPEPPPPTQNAPGARPPLLHRAGGAGRGAGRCRGDHAPLGAAPITDLIQRPALQPGAVIG